MVKSVCQRIRVRTIHPVTLLIEFNVEYLTHLATGIHCLILHFAPDNPLCSFEKLSCSDLTTKQMGMQRCVCCGWNPCYS